MKTFNTILAATLLSASASALAFDMPFFGNNSTYNNGSGDTTQNVDTTGNASGSASFNFGMSVSAKGSGKGNGNTTSSGNTSTNGSNGYEGYTPAEVTPAK